uniref:Uncharacterized protein n=1 Tax=Ditylenchus dipsaci TaxID=166011 RepID=A0A915E587_9BILA
MFNAVTRKRAIPAAANEWCPVKKMCMYKHTHTIAKRLVGFQNLPIDVACHIFNMLDYKTKVRAEIVCTAGKMSCSLIVGAK